MPEYGFSKSPIPQSWSYPLKRSVPDRSLDNAGITMVHAVYYALGKAGAPVLRVHFCGDDRKGWHARGRASISVYAVPAEMRKETEDEILFRVLPVMISRLKGMETAGGDGTRRAGDRDFVAWIRPGGIVIESE